MFHNHKLQNERVRILLKNPPSQKYVLPESFSKSLMFALLNLPNINYTPNKNHQKIQKDC